ncbi:hypothetical protein C9374_012649 [Naegleria lovaniensis]|uniref:EamA domain-containing protein n=1 Tax=Naegleria lovaniensis TaxID=51637 RepID=A0AA88H3G0_NAELO|nr:uncharacterized protein C9374_012649 [Naegleria lovaniensis]KAG2392397.1 hypothetical protein C9374_012649 [Naegleria lovaniensis]
MASTPSSEHGLVNLKQGQHVSSSTTTEIMEEHHHPQIIGVKDDEALKVHHLDDETAFIKNHNDDYDEQHNFKTIMDEHSIQAHDESPITSNSNEKGMLEKLKKGATWFFSSQLYANLLMVGTLFTFGGFCVLAPNPISRFQPPIFAFVRTSLITVVLFFLSIFIDRNYSFRSERALARYKNPILRYIKMKTPTFKMFKKLCICGSMNTINMVFFVIGLNMTSATIAGLLQPLIAEVCIFSILLKREAKGIIKILGVLISCFGAISMLGISALLDGEEIAEATDPEETPQKSILQTFSLTIGMILIVLNTLAYSVYLILLKNLTKKVPPVTLSMWTFLGGLLIPFIVACYYYPSFQFRKLDANSFIGLAYAVFIHGTLSFVMNSKASSLTSPTVIGIYNTVSPIVTTFMTVTISGETVSPWIIPGAIGILVGLAFVIFSKWREERQRQKDEQDLKAREKQQVEDSQELQEFDEQA